VVSMMWVSSWRVWFFCGDSKVRVCLGGLLPKSYSGGAGAVLEELNYGSSKTALAPFSLKNGSEWFLLLNRLVRLLQTGPKALF
jgi:hypothetical protein